MYTEEELQRFEAELWDKQVELSRRAETLRQEQELLKERGKALEAQKKEYQQVRGGRLGVGIVVAMVTVGPRNIRCKALSLL